MFSTWKVSYPEWSKVIENRNCNFDDTVAGIILCMHPANEGQRCNVMSSHWLGAYIKWSLQLCHQSYNFYYDNTVNYRALLHPSTPLAKLNTNQSLEITIATPSPPLGLPMYGCPMECPLWLIWRQLTCCNRTKLYPVINCLVWQHPMPSPSSPMLSYMHLVTRAPGYSSYLLGSGWLQRKGYLDIYQHLLSEVGSLLYAERVIKMSFHHKGW